MSDESEEESSGHISKKARAVPPANLQIRLKSSHDRPKQTKEIKKGNSSRKAKTWKDTSGFERGATSFDRIPEEDNFRSEQSSSTHQQVELPALTPHRGENAKHTKEEDVMVESKADLENLARFAAGTGVFLDNDDVEDSADDY